jgi:predicted PurR-regulated permease PerM
MDLAERKKDLLKEIDLIQSIISRMSNTSFLIKGWAVTMISFIFAFRTNQAVLPLVFIPLFLFWFLDSYFLQQERLYRKLYQWVIENRMTDDSHLFSLNATRFGKESIIKAMFSITLGTFYGIALLLNIVFLFFR